MDTSKTVRRMIVRSSLVLLLVIVSGCSMFIPPPSEPVATSVPEPAAEPAPTIVSEPNPEPRHEPEPAEVTPQPTIPSEPQNIRPLVAVVISDRAPAYVDVSQEIARYLDHHEIYDLSDRSLSVQDAFAAITRSGASAVVAVGLSAAQAAKKYSTVPVVVGQVFNLGQGDLLSDQVKAVAVLPPIELQVAAWRKLDPTIRNVGAILGPGHEDLIAETDRAMSEKGIKFHYAIAQTDRETLYLFNRLVRDIDGFILFPDNRVLSHTVLTEMMSYASRHRVQVAVFNAPLLEYGATFSSVAVPADIAATIARVLEKIIDGKFDDVPPVTGLSQIEVRTSRSALGKLGLIDNSTGTDNTVAVVQ